MYKRIIAFMCVVIILFTQAEAYAAIVDYIEGPRTYTVNLNNYSNLNGGRIESDGTLVLDAGGSVEYNFYLPFEAESASIQCRVYDSVNIIYDVGDGKEKTALSTVNTAVRHSFSKSRKAGDCSVKFTSGKTMKVSQIIYMKRKKNIAVTSDPIATDYEKYSGVKLTSFQDAVRTAVIIHPSSVMMMVNGMKKYVDYNDVSQKPMIRNGSLYIPIKAFAEATGYYYEELYDKGYALLRCDSGEFVLKDGKTYQKTVGAGYEPIENIMFAENGTTWVAVRYLSEKDSKKVMYKDGYTFIDGSENLIKAITDTAVLDEVKTVFQTFMDERTGTTYYVEKNGSDKNAGSESSPFKSISKAGEIAQPGDTVIIGGGVYEEILTPKNSGTASNPIIYKAKEGENVTISAFETVTATPKKDSDGLYVYDMGYSLGDGRNMILYKDNALTEARYPNENTSPCPFPDELNLSPLWPTRGNIIVSMDGTYALSQNDLNQPEGFWKGGTLVSLHGWGWGIGTAKIDDSTKGRLYLGKRTTEWWFSGEDSVNDYAYITGCKNAIDIPGEWYWDEDGKLYMMLPEGETPDTFKFMAKKRQITVDIADKSYIQLVGINTIGGGMKLNKSEMCVINGGEHKYISHYLFSMDQHAAFIDDCNFLDPNGAPIRGEMGFYIGGCDNAVINTKMRYSAAAGLYVTGLYAYIADNDIEECGYMANYVGGIYMVPNFAEDKWETPRGGHQILYNTVRKSGRAVIGIASCDNYMLHEYGQWPFLAMDIGYNTFSDGSICARDTGTVYFHGATVGDDRAFTRFHNNVIYNTWVAVGSGFQVYWDNWIHNAYMYDCIAFSNNREEFKNKSDFYIQSPQSFGTSYAVVDNWDNMAFGKTDKDIDTLLVDDYPNGEKFRTGVGSDDYGYNYENIDVSPSDYYAAVNAECSVGTKTAGEFVDLGRSGEWVCFRDVDFGDIYNSFEISYRGDQRLTGDNIGIIIGDSIDNGFKMSKEIKVGSYNTAKVYKERVVAPYCSGKTNVWIKANAYKSIQIGALIPIKASQEELDEILYSQTYMGNLTGKGGDILTKAGPTGEYDKTIIYNTMGANPYVMYKNVEISRDVNTFIMSTATAKPHNGQKAQLRIGSADGPVLAEITADDTSWDVYNIHRAKMRETLPKGTYDIYITFSGGGSTNAWYFAFQNKSYQTEEEAK